MIPPRSFLAVAILTLVTACTPAPPQAPNIIFIMADDLGYGDLGCYGQQHILTPHIDQLASEGTRFTACYSGSPVCAPARNTLMTGQHTGHVTVRGNFGIGGVTGLGGGEGRIPLLASDHTVAEMLHDAGYVTGMTGKWGLGEPGTTGLPNDQGFDEWLGYLNQRRAHSYYVPYLWKNQEKIEIPGNQNGGRKTYTHDLFTDFALDFIGRPHTQPFFLYLPYTLPHDEYEVPDLAPYADRDWTEKEKTFAAMVSRLDRDIGRIMAKLHALGLDEQTLVLFCSDNGAAERWEGRFDSSGPLRGRKRDVYEGGIRVPMIARMPGRVPAGAVSDFPWYFPDVLPTLAEAAGVAAPAGIDGISVWPTLMDQPQPPTDRYLYWEFHEDKGKQAVRYGKWKAVRLHIQSNPPGDPIELYDLEADPGETHNLAEAHPDIVTQLAGFMEQAHVPSPAFPFPGDSLSAAQ